MRKYYKTIICIFLTICFIFGELEMIEYVIKTQAESSNVSPP